MKFWLCLTSVALATLVQADSFPLDIQAAAMSVSVQGEVRWQTHGAKPLAPASLTKLMTVLLVLERVEPDVIVTISRAASLESGARLGLQAGEKMYRDELLKASLLYSANDACHALAEQVAGSEVAFVKLMNQRAQTLQMQHSHFSNACGHDSPQHYASADDLTRLAQAVLRYTQVLVWTTNRTLTIRNVAVTREFKLLNKNALIGRYRGAQGLKTGYTPQAGKCLIALVERDGVKVLLVLLNAPNRWWDAADIFNYAFAHADDTHTPL